MINHLERDYIFACMAAKKANEKLRIARKRWFSGFDNWAAAGEDEWRELCIAHPEYKADIFEYFGFKDEVTK